MDIPPTASNLGGKRKAVGKSIKFHLGRSIREILLTFEASATLLSQIEGLLNSRLLESLREDPEVVNALTPGHFLIGKAINSVPEPSLREINEFWMCRWTNFLQITQQF